MKFTKKTGYWSSEESWEVYSGSVKVYTSPSLVDSQTRVIEECIDTSSNNQYSLKLLDSYGDSWYWGGYLQIEGPYGNRVFKNVLTESREETYSLSLYTPILKADSWKMTSGSVTGTWTEYNFGDSSWTPVTLGSVTTQPTGTQYFRKQFVGLSGMAAYEVAFNYRYGIVAYINGAEIFRDNMGDGVPSGSTTATGSYANVGFHKVIRPGGEVANAQSVLAVEVHFLTTAGQAFVDFDSYLSIMASDVTDDTCFIYPYDITFTSTSGTDVGYIMDYDKTSYYSLSSSQITTPAIVSMSMVDALAYFNGVRVFPYTNPTAAPSTYRLQAANSASSATWTDVVVANGQIYQNNQYVINNGFFNAGLYNNYRLQIIGSSTTYVYAYEMQPLICSITIPTSIVYEPATYTYYAKYDHITIKSKISEFTGCTISPTPAEGLTFDAATCTLDGKVNSAMSVTYTVSSIMNGQTYTGSFSLTVLECTGTFVKALRTYKYNAVYEGFTIRDLTNNVVLQVNQNSGQTNNEDWEQVLCLTSNKYTITMTSSNSYWYSNSFLYINAILDDSHYDTLTRVRYDNNLGLASTSTFIADYPIKILDDWFYKMGEVPSNWYSSDTSGWTQVPSTHVYPASTNQIQLYKKTFSVSSLTDIAGVVISLKYQYGYIIYLNNHEVARKGFTGDLSTSTMSSTSLTSAGYRQISLPVKTFGLEGSPAVDYVVSGTNTIAIGLVAAGPAMTASTFDCAVRLMGSSSRALSFSYSSSYIYGSTSTLCSDYFSTYVYYSTCTTSNYYQMTLSDDRREWISSVAIKLYYTQNTQQVKQFVLKAKNPEDSEWTTLKTVTGMTWSLQGQQNRIWIPQNKAYNMYRFENFSTGDTTQCYWKFGSLQLWSDVINVDGTSLTYPSSNSIFKDIEMGEIYASSDLFYDFTVNPPLPAGIVIDPHSGTISGTASAATSAQTYIISAKKFSGDTVTAQLSLAVEICTGGRSLITLVARSDSYPARASYKVYQGKGTTGTVVASADELRAASALNYGDFCLNHAIYSLELKSTVTGWTHPAGYYLTVDIGEMKFEMGQVYSATAPASITTMFSSYLPFQIEYDDWKVYKDVTDVASDWNTINFDDSTWSTVKAADIGTSEAITVYLRRDITLDDASNYPVLNVRMKYAGGIVCYFNGRKVARFNLADDFDSTSESIEIHNHNTFSQFHIVLPTSGAVTGKNVIAFEIHRPKDQSSAEPIVFDATGVFGVNDCSIGVDSVINVSGSTGYTIGSLENFFDLTPVTYGYQSNSIGTHLQWTVENLEGTKFNSFALQTVYARTSWGFSIYARENEYLDEENDETEPEEYTSIFAELELQTLQRGRSAWSVPVGIAGFRQFKHEVDDAASSTVYISAYIFQYCKPSGAGFCEGVGDYPAVAQGEISPGECEYGFRGYSYRECTNGQLGEVKTDKCIYKVPSKLSYYTDRIIAVMNTQVNIPAPTYANLITKFYLEPNTFLPEGLELDATTGAITGVPTTESGLKTYTVYGENPKGTTSTTFNLSVRKGECKAEGNFPKTNVGEIAEYECSLAGSYVGTQKRACILGAKDGEWQKIQGTCMSISMIVILIIVVIIIIVVVVFFFMRTTKKAKSVGGVKGKKSAKSGSKKTADKKPSAKTVKV